MRAIKGSLGHSPANTMGGDRKRAAWRFPVLAQRAVAEVPRTGYWHVSACQWVDEKFVRTMGSLVSRIARKLRAVIGTVVRGKIYAVAREIPTRSWKTFLSNHGFREHQVKSYSNPYETP
jgi:hypothetical protein